MKMIIMINFNTLWLFIQMQFLTEWLHLNPQIHQRWWLLGSKDSYPLFSAQNSEGLSDRSGHWTPQVDCQTFPTAKPIGVDCQERPPNGPTITWLPNHANTDGCRSLCHGGCVVAEVWDLALGGAFLISALQKHYWVWLGLACSHWQILQGSGGSAVSVFQQPTQPLLEIAKTDCFRSVSVLSIKLGLGSSISPIHT